MRVILHLIGVVLCVVACEAHAKESQLRRVFLAGDSTVAEYGVERAPRQGWGQQLQTYLDPSAFEVHNHAIGGRSSRSFIEEGRLDAIAQQLRKGDVLIVQFGHNDAKYEDPRRYTAPDSAYPQWLMRYVELARTRGALPILVTPVSRRLWDFGSLLDTHARYTDAMRSLADRESIALIDLNASSTLWLRALGEQASRSYFEHVPERGIADDTHLSAAGATLVACLVVRDWKQLDTSLGTHVVRDTDCGAEGQAHALATSRRHPSLVQNETSLALIQPGPHGGAGRTTAYPLFAEAEELDFVVRKRVLHKGAGIGLHPQHKDEIYYVVSGQGRYILDGQLHAVSSGHAMLTRPGSTHAIEQQGEQDLVLLIVYPSPRR